MRLRQKKGGTLALVIAATITLILLGICFFFLAQMFGGEREMQHATDSGNLNVAKNALRSPAVGLQSGDEINSFGELGDRTLAKQNGKFPINLLTYDRCMAQALLACFNANESDGDGTAAAHANKMVNLLQGGAGSIGGRLAAGLTSQDSSINPLLKNYSETADQNSLRMLGQDSVMNRKDTEYTVAFLENKAIDTGCIGATNIEVTNKSLIPAGMQAQYITSKVGPDGKSHDYLRGYIQPADGNIAKTPVGVPMQPGDQPHLVSNKTFTNQIAAPFGPGVPPNGFRSASNAFEQRSNQQASTLACSEVGSLNMTFPFSAPYGYIMVVNGPDTGGTDSVPGPFVGLDHVLNNELLNPGGIFVGSNVFSTDKGLLDNWAQFNSDPVTYTQKNASDPVGYPLDKSTGQPPLQGVNSADSSSPTPIFKLDGTPAKASDLAQMKFSGSGMNATANGVTCTDSNSTADGNATCYKMLTNPAQPNDVFDKAYHPGGGYTTGAGTTDSGDGGGLLAVECAKCQLQHRFNSCTDLSIDNGNCGQTGLRVPRAGKDWRAAEAPSSTTNCQISDDSTIKGLADFVQDGFGDTLDQLIAARCNQIIPSDLTGKGNGAAQYNAKIKNTVLGLGRTYYIYAPNPDATPPGSGKTDTSMDLVIDTTGPSWRVAGTQPDGKPVSASHANYNIVGTAVNPHHDRGIHDIMYRDHPDAGINATDTATWTPSTSFENLLGKVQFTESASGYAAGFCKPD